MAASRFTCRGGYLGRIGILQFDGILTVEIYGKYAINTAFPGQQFTESLKNKEKIIPLFG